MLSDIKAKMQAYLQKHLYSEETGHMLNFITLEI